MSSGFFKKLKEFIPDLNSVMAESAAHTDINKLERDTGYNFSDDFKEFYKCHNGEKDGIGVFLGFKCLSIKEILQHWSSNRQYYEDAPNYGIISFEKDVIKEVYFHPDWLPIGYDYGGNYIGIDFSPGKNGTIGQIINFGRDEHELFVIGESFGAFLEFVLCQFKIGKCKLEPDEEENRKYVVWKEYGHFFNDLKEILTNKNVSQIVNAGTKPYWNSLDDNWKNAIIQNLGYEPETIKDLLKIRTLNLLNSNISDLTPIKEIKHLRKLIASGLNLIDFSAVSGLKEIKSLYLAKTPFCNLEILSPLKTLKELSIGNSRVDQISTVYELINLESLSLENLTIKDMSPLKKCKKLKSLNVSGIKTQSLNEIGSMVNLIELDMSRIKMDNLSFLKNLTNLRDISLDKCENGDYSVLKNFNKIESITCPFEIFLKTKHIFSAKIDYTIRGGMSEQEGQIYENYVMEKITH